MFQNIDYENFSSETIKSLILSKKKFRVSGIPIDGFDKVTSRIESIIESNGKSCRIYTTGRLYGLAAALIPTPATMIGGIGVGVAAAIHNIATYNPDYEIARNLVGSCVDVEYKK